MEESQNNILSEERQKIENIPYDSTHRILENTNYRDKRQTRNT